VARRADLLDELVRDRLARLVVRAYDFSTWGSNAQFSMICDGSSTKSRETPVPEIRLVGAVRQKAVQRVAELVEQRVHFIDAQKRRLIRRGFVKFPTL